MYDLTSRAASSSTKRNKGIPSVVVTAGVV